MGALLLSNFKTKCKTGYISTSLATWGSNWASKEAKFIKEFNFLGFSRCFSAKIKQTSKNHPKMAQFGWILDVFEDYSILAEKQRLKPKNSNSLKFFASFDTLLDPRGAKVVETNFTSKIALFEMIWESFNTVCIVKVHKYKHFLSINHQLWTRGIQKH